MMHVDNYKLSLIMIKYIIVDQEYFYASSTNEMDIVLRSRMLCRLV